MAIAIITRTTVRLRNKLKRSLYWWDPVDGSINTGDFFSKVLVQKILETRNLKLADKKSKKNRLFAIGSVLHYAKTGDCIWGTGVNGNIAPSHHTFGMLDVRAVRGPLTRDFLISRSVPCPERYGDPGILAPWIYPKRLFIGTSPHREYLVVPHLLGDPKAFEKHQNNLCKPTLAPVIFIRRVVNSSLVISSSLHGIILAESYGVPAIFLRAGHTEKAFKYDDYYLGTGRADYPVAASVNEALLMPAPRPPDFTDQQRSLFDAFPFDLWPE